MNPLFSFQFKCCYIQMLTKCLLVQVCYTTSVLELNKCQVSSRACISIVWQQLLRVYCTLLRVLCSHVCAFGRLIAPMRSIKPPVRFANPIYYVNACKKRMMPFEGQPRKWKLVRRFPRLEVRLSSIPNAGFGLFVAEDVKVGQPIATYRRRIVSEAMAKELKKKVSNVYDRNIIS